MKSRKTSEIEKLGERVYKTEDYLEVLKDVIEDITKQTHFMSDEELQYDRTRFIRQVKDLDIASLEEKNGYEDYDRDIHTLAILTTQLIRFGSILYLDSIYEKALGFDTDDFDRDNESGEEDDDGEENKKQRSKTTADDYFLQYKANR
jgi:hypothetical protein